MGPKPMPRRAAVTGRLTVPLAVVALFVIVIGAGLADRVRVRCGPEHCDVLHGSALGSLQKIGEYPLGAYRGLDASCIDVDPIGPEDSRSRSCRLVLSVDRWNPADPRFASVTDSRVELPGPGRPTHTSNGKLIISFVPVERITVSPRHHATWWDDDTGFADAQRPGGSATSTMGYWSWSVGTNTTLVFVLLAVIALGSWQWYRQARMHAGMRAQLPRRPVTLSG